MNQWLCFEFLDDTNAEEENILINHEYFMDEENRTDYDGCCLDFSSQVDFKELTALLDLSRTFKPSEMPEDVCHALVKRFVIHCCQETIKRGHLRCFRFFHKQGIQTIFSFLGVDFEAKEISSKEEGFLLLAVKLGRLNFLEDELVFSPSETLQPFDHSYLRLAASHGHLNVLEFAHSRGLPLYDGTIWKNSVQHRQLKVFEFGVLNSLVDAKTLAEAAKLGLVAFLEIGLMSNHIQDESIWDAAASHGHVKCLKIAADNNIFLSKNVWVAAASKGFTNIIRFGLDGNYWLDEDVWLAAIENRQWNVLMLALFGKIFLSDKVWIQTVKKGVMQPLKMAMVVGYSFSERVMDAIYQKWDRRYFENC